MEGFLDKPNIEKSSVAGQGNGHEYGIVSMQGWRFEMEDSHSAVTQQVDDTFKGIKLIIFNKSEIFYFSFVLQIGHSLPFIMVTVDLYCQPTVERTFFQLLSQMPFILDSLSNYPLVSFPIYYFFYSPSY